MASATYAETVRLYGRRGYECACGDLRMAARAVTRFYDSFFASLGVGANQISILWAVMALEPAPVHSLAQALCADATTLTRTLKTLEREGYLQAARGQDRRERRYRLTRQGQALMVRALPLWEDAQASLTARLGASGQLPEIATQLLRLSAAAQPPPSGAR